MTRSGIEHRSPGCSLSKIIDFESASVIFTLTWNHVTYQATLDLTRSPLLSQINKMSEKESFHKKMF